MLSFSDFLMEASKNQVEHLLQHSVFRNKPEHGTWNDQPIFKQWVDYFLSYDIKRLELYSYTHEFRKYASHVPTSLPDKDETLKFIQTLPINTVKALIQYINFITESYR